MQIKTISSTQQKQSPSIAVLSPQLAANQPVEESEEIPDLSIIEEPKSSISLLSGENLLSYSPNYVTLSIEQIPNHKVYLMYITSYRMYLTPTIVALSSSRSTETECISIPHAYLKEYQVFDNEIRFQTKTSLRCFLVPEESSKTQEIYSRLIEAKKMVPFCFQVCSQDEEPVIYDCEAEMDRMLINWKHVLAIKNPKGQFCDTYPKTVFISNKLSSEIVQECKKSRVNSRIPVLTYYDKESGVSLWRGARTVREHNSKYDYSYLESISQNLLIIEIQNTDNRKESIYGFNHFNNQIKHSVYRFESLYQVRVTYEKMLHAYLKNESLLKCAGKWFEEIDLLLKCSFKCVEHLTTKRHVLVQENDLPNNGNGEQGNFLKGGIDRACQISALTSVLCDPYYRSVKGLTVLIEKEFISYGYPFKNRCGVIDPGKTPQSYENSAQKSDHSIDLSPAKKQPSSAKKSGGQFQLKDLMNSVMRKNSEGKDINGQKSKAVDGLSPTFIQFLECLNQLINCFPHSFEYTSFFLAHLGYELFTGRYNNFLFNSIYEFEQKIKSTRSLYRYCAMKRKYYNLQFRSNFTAHKKLTKLRSAPNVKEYIVWKEYWGLVSEMKSEENEESEIESFERLRELMQQRKEVIYSGDTSCEKVLSGIKKKKAPIVPSEFQFLQ